MYRVFTLVVLMALIGSAAGATDTLSTDGAWWNGLSASQQTAVMFGSTSAYGDGYADGVAEEEVQMHHIVSNATYIQKNQRDALSSRLDNEFREADYPEFTGKPIRAYIDGMTSFYTSHPEAFNMEFSDVFACIQNKPSFTCNEVAANYLKNRKTSQ